MKIEPKSGPSATPSTTVNQSARDRAIALLSGASSGNDQATPVASPNNVSIEELSAVSGQANTDRETTNSVESLPAESKATESAPKEDPISTQYANLARKEKQLRAKALQQEQAYKAKEAAIAAKEAELKLKESEYSTKFISKDKLNQDTLNALADAGLTYDQITELMLNQQDPQKMERQQYEKRLEAKIKELEDKQLAAERKAESQQSESYKQAIAQIKSDVTRLVDSPEFETIKETNSIADVVELIERTFKQDGVLLTVEDAAKQVEEYLVEEAFKLTKLKKIQQRLTSAKAPEVKQEPPKTATTMKTLTNAVSSSGKLSVRDRAIAAFKGELK
jgi:hypothetical protein